MERRGGIFFFFYIEHVCFKGEKGSRGILITNILGLEVEKLN
jgi:hypothetical protein